MAQPKHHSVETAIDEAVDVCAERAFAFLEELVREPSLPGAEQGAEDILAAELERIGMAVERVPFPEAIEHDAAAGVGPGPYDGRTIVVGRLGRDRGRRLLLNGHLDVVPAGEERLWSSPPFAPSIRDGWMVGRGAGDMKAGLAMGTLAIEALLAAAPGREPPMTLVGAIEEEQSGNGTLASIRAGVVGDAAILLEPTDLELLVAGIGVLWFEVEVFAEAGHALGAGPAMGALTIALRVIEELRRVESELNMLGGRERHALNVGTLTAGEWQSSIPSAARLGCRLGFPRGMAVDEAMRRVRVAVDRAAGAEPAFAAPRVRFNGFRAEGYELPADDPLVAALGAAHRSAHGRTPAVVTTAGTTDARFYRNQLGIPALCYGPRVENMHAADERVELASIVAGARTLARFLHAWGEGS
ncbi:MAG TPA: M20/M25/M40 family metallo-hydrolase [Gaiellales bacterium]|nr:M20/M25/M40 family metallo-hydrolase [Gaiellales bacterium]